jgi:hypothetical protein
MSQARIYSKKEFVRFLKNFIKKQLRAFLLSVMLRLATRLLVAGIIVAGLVFGLYKVASPLLENNVVVSQSEIVSRVSKLTTLPSDEEPLSLVRVEDAEVLKKQNDFYRDSAIKEGDYILVYPSGVVIYDLRNNAIVAVKKK